MEFTERKLDEEAVESAFQQIHFYINLPRHIKGIITEFKDVKPNNLSQNNPAYVVKGSTTVINGKLNIPTVNQEKKFLNRVVTQ